METSKMNSIRQQIYEQGYWLEKSGKGYIARKLDDNTFRIVSNKLSALLELILCLKGK